MSFEKYDDYNTANVTSGSEADSIFRVDEDTMPLAVSIPAAEILATERAAAIGSSQDPLEKAETTTAETTETPTEVEEGGFSVRSAAKYLNPVRIAKGYGRFVKDSMSEFGWGEAAGTLLAVGGGLATLKTGSDILGSWTVGGAAGAYTLGENIGFFGGTYLQRYHEYKSEGDSRQVAHVKTVEYIRDLLTIGELIDIPSRPLSAYAGIAFAKAKGVDSEILGVDADLVGLTIGKLVADHLYYGVATPFAGARKEYKEAVKNGENTLALTGNAGRIDTFARGFKHINKQIRDFIRPSKKQEDFLPA